MKKSIGLLLVVIFILAACQKEKSVDISTTISAIENGLLRAVQVKDEPAVQFNIYPLLAY